MSLLALSAAFQGESSEMSEIYRALVQLTGFFDEVNHLNMLNQLSFFFFYVFPDCANFVSMVTVGTDAKCMNPSRNIWLYEYRISAHTRCYLINDCKPQAYTWGNNGAFQHYWHCSQHFGIDFNKQAAGAGTEER